MRVAHICIYVRELVINPWRAYLLVIEEMKQR